MTEKLSSRQQAQLAFLDQIIPRLPRIYTLIERLSTPSEVETAGRQLARMLDELKVGAAGVSISGVADAAASMSTLARRTGDVQTRLRGLRELFVSLKANYDGARKKASKPEEDDESGG